MRDSTPVLLRLLIVDDHPVVREGLRSMLAGTAIEVVGEAGTATEAIRLATDVDPDVVLLDLGLPDLDALSTVARLKQVRAGAAVLVLTMHDDPAYAQVARAAGASGHVIKDSESSELLAAIRAVHRGRVFMQVSADAEPATPVAASARAPALSQRERQVLEMLARGHTNREIAHRLSLSTKTVETHRSRLGDKLGLHTRAELVRLALDLGLIR